jgi:hypothetical protein
MVVRLVHFFLPSCAIVERQDRNEMASAASSPNVMGFRANACGCHKSPILDASADKLGRLG